MVVGLDMRLLGKKWQKKIDGNRNGNRMSGLTGHSLRGQSNEEQQTMDGGAD